MQASFLQLIEFNQNTKMCCSITLNPSFNNNYYCPTQLVWFDIYGTVGQGNAQTARDRTTVLLPFVTLSLFMTKDVFNN